MHYHGTPVTPKSVMASLAGRNFCVRFGRHEGVEHAHAIGQSVMLDNGAFGVWKSGAEANWPGYYTFCEQWLGPTTWAVCPDVIEGDEDTNDALLREWPFGDRGAPVWHMHDDVGRLVRLCSEWPRVCIGSSAEFAKVGTPQWHRRMEVAMAAICDSDGRPPVWLHMLRGMALVRGPYPFASVDSTDVAQNHHAAKRGHGQALKMAELWDSIQCPRRWEGAEQAPLFESRVAS